MTVYPKYFSSFMSRLRSQLLISESEFELLNLIKMHPWPQHPKKLLYQNLNEELYLYVVTSGWLMAYSDFINGKRYVHRLYQAGDIIGTEDTNWDYATSTVETITECILGKFRKENYYNIISSSPKLGAALYGVSMTDQIISMDTARANLRLLAEQRVGHFLLQIEARQKLTVNSTDGVFTLPVTQVILADCLGLSNVQVNKSLILLGKRGIIKRDVYKYQIEKRDELIKNTGFINRYDVTQSKGLNFIAD